MSPFRSRSSAPTLLCDQSLQYTWGKCVRHAESQSRSRALPGPRALRRARPATVRARRARQRARDRRRERAGGARGQGLARQGELSRACDRGHREGEAMSTRPPVSDWETDFDHLDPRWVNDPYPIWQELRAQCPVAHTERYMGVYFPTRYDDVRAVAYDTEHFSSRRIIVREQAPPRIPAPPITSDPPG